jgi:hypothetical protein
MYEYKVSVVYIWFLVTFTALLYTYKVFSKAHSFLRPFKVFMSLKKIKKWI